MFSRPRTCTILLLICVLSARPAWALFNLNEGKDLIFVNASYSIGYDSNVFTRSSANGSFTQAATLAIDYSRQAGIISVNANASMSSGTFAGIRGQDFLDPSLSLAFRKRYGRTTGALTLTAHRDSQPDFDANTRTQAWAYGTNLDLHYPVNDRYYITDNIGYNGKFYADSLTFSDLNTWSEGVFINYIYTSKLDLNGGYTIRVSDTSKSTKAYDNSFTIGASGGILPKLSGTIRMGYQFRTSESVLGGREEFSAFNSATQLKWLYSRKMSFSGDISEDFSTSSTDISTDRFSTGVHVNTSLTTKMIGNFGVSYSDTKYLGKAGEGREDYMVQFDASVGVAITTRWRATLNYLYQVNWSNKPNSDFKRETITLTLLAAY